MCCLLRRDGNKKAATEENCSGSNHVGVKGLEPSTPCSQSRCASQLRHTPIDGAKIVLICYNFSFFSNLMCIFTLELEITRVMKLLIVEDDPSLRELMLRALTEEKYVVETASGFAEADSRIAGYNYDCILLDIMLPGGNGLQLLDRIRELHKKENVIIISAKDSLEDKVSGLEKGADDYLPKPFHMAELKARIRSVLRRGRTGGNLSIECGNVSIQPENGYVEVAGKHVELLRKEFDILLYFMQRPNHLVDKSVLAEAVWGDHADQADDYHFVYAQMKNLRRKLHAAGADIEIKAVYGFGYKLVI